MTNSNSFTPPTHSLGAFIWYFIRRQGWKFAILFIGPMAVIIESNALPYSLKMIVDTIGHYTGDPRDIFQALKPALWLAGGGWVVMIVIFRLQDWVGNVTYPRMQAELRMGSFRYVLGHSHRYFSEHFAGSIANKIGDMPRAAQELAYFLCWRIIASLSVIAVTVGVMATIDIRFLFVMVLWIAAHWSIAYALARRVSRISTEHSEERSTLQGKIVDVLTNMPNVRMFARNDFESGYIGAQQKIERDLNQRVFTEMWKVRICVEFPTFAMMAAIMVVLIRGWQEGRVTAGDFAFVFYATWNILHWVWQFSVELPQLFNNIGVLRQAWTVIAPPHEIADAPDAPTLKVTRGEITFDKVNFHYRPEYNIFADKSLVIEGGEKVGLVGFSGSGKTTFVNLILRFYDVESGRILIDGQDIACVTQDSLRSSIAMIPQDTSLFHRTLMENIRYGRLDATDDEVIEASKRAHCHEFIARLPEEYDSLVGERGVKLSGGQRQRIAIARAILKNASILLLDEATSALDSATEKSIKASLAELMQGRTTIVVAHRLSTLSDMDRILVFDEGHIIEEGAHEELLRSKGHYAMMWNMQAGGFLPDERE